MTWGSLDTAPRAKLSSAALLGAHAISLDNGSWFDYDFKIKTIKYNMITVGYENVFQKYLGNKGVVLQMISNLFALA